jgi:hypothetical protein
MKGCPSFALPRFARWSSWLFGLEGFEGGRRRRTEDSFLLLSLTLIEFDFEQADFFTQPIHLLLLFQTAFAQVDSIIARVVKLIPHAVSPYRFILSTEPPSSNSFSL